MPGTTQLTTRRRIALSMLVILAVLGVFVWRLVDIQVVNAEQLNADALERRAGALTLYGSRGEILDNDGTVLAGSVNRFNITAVPEYVSDSFQREVDGTVLSITRDQAVQELASLTGVPAEDILTSITENPESNFAYVARSVDYDVLKEVRALGIPWVSDERQPARTYPNGAVGGNLTGWLGTDGPGGGVELYLNECLKQTDGYETYERNADGVAIPGSTVVTEEAVNGLDVRLTIDSDLQWYAQQVIGETTQELGGEWGIAVVMEVKTGKLLAVAEYPTVDPNNPSGTDQSTYASRSFSTPYEPGSVMKPVTIAALLDAGVITPNTAVSADYTWEPEAQVRIRDAVGHPTWNLTATGVLVRSSNVGTAKLSTLLDESTLSDYYEAFGFGKRTEVRFGGSGGESAGIYNPIDTSDRATRYNATYGAGISTTAVQLASAYQTIANGGVRMPVTLVEGCVDEEGNLFDLQSEQVQVEVENEDGEMETVTETQYTIVPSQPKEGTRVVSESAADQTVLMLENVLNKGGLASTTAIDGYRVGIKTGTAEVAAGGIYTNDRVVSVIGVAPIEDPQYVVVTTIGKPQTGRSSASAGPPFRKIMSQVLKMNRVEPSTTPASDLPVESQ